jgi:hypothetical protein
MIQSGVEPLQPLINKFTSNQEDMIIEIVSMSLLLHGSAMGTGSILGGYMLSLASEDALELVS